MKIDDREISYNILFARGKDKQVIPVVDVADESNLLSLVRVTCKGRTMKPATLKYSDGVDIWVRKLDHIRNQVSLMMHTRIYNKSVRQARIDVEKAIRNS